MTQAVEELQAEGVELNDSSTVISESSDSDSSFRHGIDASSFDGGAPTPIAARTAALQHGAHISGPGYGEDIREGSTRGQTRVFHQEAAAGLISVTGRCDGGRIFHSPLTAKRQAVNRLSCRTAFSRRRNQN